MKRKNNNPMYTKNAKIAHAGINCKGYINGGSCSLSAAPPGP
jgi:hypothetical protein